MLYHMHEMHRASLVPLRFYAEVFQHIYTNPWVPVSYTGLGRIIAANCELVERTTRKYKKPAFGLKTTKIDGKTVAVREEAALETSFCTLLHFARDEPRNDPRVLVVAPMSGHYATLLRGTVEALLPEHDVYITDWHDAREVPRAKGRFDLDDYIALVMEFLRHLGPNTHILSVCQPSVPVMAAVSMMAAQDDPCQPATMILLGGPIDTRINPTQVNLYAVKQPIEWFAQNVIHSVPLTYPGRGRQVYPGFVQLTGFMSMNLDRHVNAHNELYHHLIKGDGDSAEQHRKFYDEYLSVMDMPAEFYLQTIETVFHTHDLPNGTMKWRGELVQPALIKKTALMTVEGEKDDITGPGQCAAAHDLCTGLPLSMHRHHLQPQVGHYGIFNGRRWREEILPNVSNFIRTHDHGA